MIENRKRLKKYIKNEEFLVRFDDSEYDKMIFPFYDESKPTYDRLFQFDQQHHYKSWITKFQDPEEQGQVKKLQLNI